MVWLKPTSYSMTCFSPHHRQDSPDYNSLLSVRIGTGTCKIMLRSQITLDPVILLISHPNLTFIFIGSCRIILAGHHLIVKVLSNQQFSGIRHIDCTVRIIFDACIWIRIRGRCCRSNGIRCRQFFLGTEFDLPERNRIAPSLYSHHKPAGYDTHLWS